MRRRFLWFAVLAAATATTLASASAAYATWPGRNGRIAFLRDVNVFTANAHGKHVRQLTRFAPDTDLDIASWSPDSRQLVVGHFTPDTVDSDLYIMRADGTDVHRVFADPDFFDEFPSFTPDGRHIVFMRCGSGCSIWRVRVDGKGLTDLTPPTDDVTDIAPTVAPDSHAMAFGSLNRGDVESGIYRSRPDGSHVRLITPPDLQAFTPDWSPDSASIAFQSNALGSIFTMNDHGANLARLTNPEVGTDLIPSWSPRQDRIAFWRDSPDSTQDGIWVMRPDGSHKHRILENARARRWGSAH